jgi:hypothetical protein
MTLRQPVGIAEENVKHEHAGHAQHGQAKRAENGNGQRGKAERRGNDVAPRRQAGAAGDVVLEDE